MIPAPVFMSIAGVFVAAALTGMPAAFWVTMLGALVPAAAIVVRSVMQ